MILNSAVRLKFNSGAVEDVCCTPFADYHVARIGDLVISTAEFRLTRLRWHRINWNSSWTAPTLSDDQPIPENGKSRLFYPAKCPFSPSKSRGFGQQCFCS